MTATMQPKSEAAEAPRRGKRTPGTGENTRPRRGPMQFGHWWWALPGIALVFAIHYVATGIGGFFAFTNWTGIGSFKITGWTNFEAIFKDPTKLGALSNTLFLAFGSVLLGNIAGLVIALGLNRVAQDALHPPDPLLHAGGAQPARHGLHLEVHLRLRRSAQWLPYGNRRRRPCRSRGSPTRSGPSGPSWWCWSGFDRLCHGDLHGRPGRCPRGGRGGGGHRRRQSVAAVPQRYAARHPPRRSPSRPRWESSRGCASSTRSWRSPAADRPERPKRWPRRFTSRPLRSGTSGAVRRWPWCSPPSS